MTEHGVLAEHTSGYLIMRQIILIVLLLLGVCLGKVSADGGDFQLDFAAAAPFTYDHATGGGAWNDGTIGKNNDVVESLEGGDFACGDIVTHFVRITIDDAASGVQAIELDFSFLADTTGQSGVALGDITGVAINYGGVQNGAGPGNIDTGMIDDLGSTAQLIAESISGTKFTAGAELLGTVLISDLEAAEEVISRIDTRLECVPGSRPTGNLQSDIVDARVVSPVADVISVGNQTVPFKQTGEIAFPEVDLIVEKMDNPDPIEFTFENTLSYRIEVTNGSGDNVAENVVMVDTLDPNTQFLSISPAEGCSHDGSLSGGTITCNLGAMAPSETRVFDVTVQLLASAPTDGDGGTGPCSETSDLCNRVSVSSDTQESNPLNNSDSEPTDVVFLNAGSIVIEKNPEYGVVYNPTDYTYTYDVYLNQHTIGPVQVNDVSDDKCSPLNYLGGDNGNGWLEPGETWMYDCTTTLEVDTHNIATVNATDIWTGTSLTASDSADVNVINPALGIEKSVDKPVILAGETVTYTFNVLNTGDDPLEIVTVSDTVEGATGCAPINRIAGDDGNNVLDLYETWTFECSTALYEDTLNIATASGYDSLSNQVNSNQADAFVDVIRPDIMIEKSSQLSNDADQNGLPGTNDTLTYSFLITNTGDSTLYNVTLEDDNQGFGVLGPFVCTTTLPATLAAQGTITCTADYLITQADVDAGSIDNLATTKGTPDVGPDVSDSDPHTVTLPQAPGIMLLKSGSFDAGGDGIAQPGELITYTFTVENTGNVTLTNVTVTDPLFTVNGGPISLDPGQIDSTTFTGSYAVTQADIDAGQVDNTALAQGNPPAGDPVSDDD